MTIIGAGGAATAIQVQCALDGAKEITIFNIKDAFMTKRNKLLLLLNKKCQIASYIFMI